MFQIWNSSQESLTRKAYVIVGGSCSISTKRYLELDPMDATTSTSLPCSPSKRLKFSKVDNASQQLLQSPTANNKSSSEKQQTSVKVKLHSEESFNRNNNNADEQQQLFTFSQLVMICERKLREQRNTLDDEYDKTLREKLSEQYDTFIKFRRDQIEHQILQCRPSYLSWVCLCVCVCVWVYVLFGLPLWYNFIDRVMRLYWVYIIVSIIVQVHHE